MKYAVISYVTICEFSKAVNAMLEKGYVPQGSVVVGFDGNGQPVSFTQALIKPQKNA